MKVLTVTSLFPNSERPEHGIFIQERMKVWQERTRNEWVVVAPVPWFPQTKILSCFKKWHRFSRVPKEEVLEGIRVYHPRYLIVPKIGMFLHGYLMGLSLASFLKQLRVQYPFDLIDAHYVYPDGAAVRLVAKILKVPYVISARGTDINFYPHIRTIRPQIKKVLDNSARVISVSQGLKDIMSTDLAVPSKKISVIGNGIDLDRFYPIDQKKARAHCGLPVDRRIILSVGALIERKNYLEYLKAISRLDKKDILAIIIGAGDQQKVIEDHIQKHGLQDRVILKGVIPHADLVWWYSSADLFCLSSIREGWANVLMEAMGCGLPSVATPAIGSSEIIATDDIGLLTKGFRVEDIALALKTALGKTWDRDKVRKRAEQRDWQRVAREVQDVFDEVLRT